MEYALDTYGSVRFCNENMENTKVVCAVCFWWFWDLNERTSFSINTCLLWLRVARSDGSTARSDGQAQGWSGRQISIVIKIIKIVWSWTLSSSDFDFSFSTKCHTNVAPSRQLMIAETQVKLRRGNQNCFLIFWFYNWMAEGISLKTFRWIACEPRKGNKRARWKRASNYDIFARSLSTQGPDLNEFKRKICASSMSQILFGQSQFFWLGLLVLCFVSSVLWKMFVCWQFRSLLLWESLVCV